MNAPILCVGCRARFATMEAFKAHARASRGHRCATTGDELRGRGLTQDRPGVWKLRTGKEHT